jgi:nitrate reductase cytochrome c-type subunit
MISFPYRVREIVNKCSYCWAVNHLMPEDIEKLVETHNYRRQGRIKMITYRYKCGVCKTMTSVDVGSAFPPHVLESLKTATVRYGEC